MNLQRLVLTFGPRGGVEIRTLYRTQDGSNPGTKARQRGRLRSSPGPAYRTPWRP
jgi:hypothetical protein